VTTDPCARRDLQESAIVCEGLTKRYGDLVALDQVSFDVPAGQLVALLGPNGAGKTTTIELLEGYLAPTGGTVRVLGADPRRGGRAWRARIGLVLQSTSLDEQLTVRELLSVFAQSYPEPQRVPEVLELLDLTGEAGVRVGALSGGQRRRVDVALGIIGRPELLFLDEPTTGLDPEARRRAWAAVEQLAGTGTTVVLTTHYLEEASQLADRVIVLAGGRILADTTPERLRAQAAGATIRYRLPDTAVAADLPAALAGHLDPDHRDLVVHSADVTAVLGELVGWAERHHLDLAGLEVGPPTLEEAYLTVIGQPLTEEPARHG
jgi:ABC-2 type transport system ATP-binding protein